MINVYICKYIHRNNTPKRQRVKIMNVSIYRKTSFIGAKVIINFECRNILRFFNIQFRE